MSYNPNNKNKKDDVNQNYSNNKLLLALMGQLVLACALSGCASSDYSSTETRNTADSAASSDEISYLDDSNMFTDRDKEVGYDADSSITITLADGSSSSSDSSVVIEQDTITLTAAGTYLISGSLSNGQVIVDAPEDAKVQLVLEHADINCGTSAALYVRQADKVFITLAAGSDNTLSTTGDYIAIDDNNIDSVIFSKEDLTLNGSGTLTVNAAYGHGIVSKDDLVITGGTYSITAANHALAGKDSVRIADGLLSLDAGKDGIHSENTDDTTKGFIYIAGGDIHIQCGSDGIDGSCTVQIADGTLDISAGDDGIHSDSDLIIVDGTIDIAQSYEGLEGMTITVEGGDINVVASDDGLNAAGDGTTSSTDNADDVTSADRMTPPDNAGNMTPPDNTGNMTPPDNTGNMTPPDNTGNMTPPDNADGTTPPERPDTGTDNRDIPDTADNNKHQRETPGPKGGMGGGFEKANDYNFINITGGTLHINAQGDGIDSNGNLTVSGGETYISGPTSGGNGALDYAGEAVITGGTVIAAGSSGMAVNFDTDSPQQSMLVTVAPSNISGALTLTDANGNMIISYSPEKEYNSVVISCPELTKGTSYTLTAGDTTTTVEL